MVLVFNVGQMRIMTLKNKELLFYLFVQFYLVIQLGISAEQFGFDTLIGIRHISPSS